MEMKQFEQFLDIKKWYIIYNIIGQVRGPVHTLAKNNSASGVLLKIKTLKMS